MAMQKMAQLAERILRSLRFELNELDADEPSEYELDRCGVLDERPRRLRLPLLLCRAPFVAGLLPLALLGNTDKLLGG